MNAKKTYYILFYAAIIAFTSFFTSSCRKKRLDTFVEGRVMTYGTNQKATNRKLTVNLYSHGIGERLEQEGKTDTNGYFSFDFTADKSRSSYYVRLLEGAAGHSGPSGWNPRYLDIGERQTVNFYLSPQAWLKLHIENVNPQPGDLIRVRWGTEVRSLNGNINEEILFVGGGNTDRVIQLSLLRNSEWKYWNDTVSLLAFDTIYHKIEY